MDCPRAMPPVHTIGHSTRTIEAFVALLRAGAVDTVVDIRTIPRSRTNPQFNPDALAAALAGYQIAHARIAALGALRKATAAVPPEVNGSWTNRSFHNYADYALTRDFRSGLADLEGLAGERRVAIMCAEAVWWHCHRRIVAEYLLASLPSCPPSQRRPPSTAQQARVEDPGHAAIPVAIWVPAIPGEAAPHRHVPRLGRRSDGPCRHGAALAEARFVVVAPMHPGDNFQDDSAVGRPEWLADRARHSARPCPSWRRAGLRRRRPFARTRPGSTAPPSTGRSTIR
jgi:hypothetical protein